MLDLGMVKPGETIYIPFHTFDSNDPSASVIISDFVVGDIEIYKDGSVTQRASDAGYTLLDSDGINFDGITGVHGISIDLSDNTTAGFYAAGSQYWVVIGPITVDAATINFVAATFRIGVPGALLNTTIAAYTSTDNFTLNSGSTNDDAYNGCILVAYDVATEDQIQIGVVEDYTGSTKTINLKADPGVFTMAANDNICIMPPALLPTTAGHTLDVTSTGAAGIDWGNVENASTAVDLSATDIQLVDTTTTNTDMITAATIADAVWDETSAGHTDAGKAGEQLWTDVDAILVDTNSLNDTKVPDTISLANINAEVDTALTGIGLDHLVSAAVVGADVTDNSVVAKLVSASATADWDDFVNTTDSLQAIRDRGDAAWTTGGGGSITDILNVTPIIPTSIDLANTATVRLGLALTNALDDLPSTAEITPGTISIERKAIGGTSWSAVVTDAACSEAAGHIYYDEVFDSGTGYAEGDSIRITFKSQKIVVAANDYEITDATGIMFQTYIRETMRGTDSAFLAASAPTNFGDLSITATTGRVDVAAVAGTSQTAGDIPALVTTVDTVVDGIQTDLDNGTDGLGAIKAETALIVADTNELQTDWADGGRLDVILDARMAEASINTTGGAVDTVTAVTNQVSADMTAISGTAAAADNLEAVWANVDTQINVASATASTIVFDDAAMIGTDEYYTGMVVFVYGGTGAGQSRRIIAYTGATKTATVAPNWGTNPDATSDVIVVVSGSADVQAYGGAAGTFSGGRPEVNTSHVGGTSQTAGDIPALVTTVDTVVDGIQSDLDNGTDGLGALKTLIDTVDTVVDAIKAKTDSLTFTVANQVDANALSVSGTTQTAGDIPALVTTVDTVVDGIQTDLDNATDGLGALKTLIDTVDTVVDAIKAKTDSLTFTVANQVDSNMLAISGTTASADNLEESTKGIITGAAQTGTLSTTVMTSDLAGYADDELIGRTIIWVSGTANGQATDITDYASASGTVTYTAVTTAPVDGDTFVIV